MLVRLVTGCSWEDAERLCGSAVSDTPARGRRDEWMDAGVFDAIATEAIAAFDKVIRLDLSEAASRRSPHNAPAGGDRTGKNPTDRAKLGRKWSILTEKNRHSHWLDHRRGEPRGLLGDIETLWLDRGYDSEVARKLLAARGIDDAIIARQRRRGAAKGPKNLKMGLRWPVERTNSWLSNYGQLRRNTDRKSPHRLAQLALAVAFLLTAKLIDWRNRWTPGLAPIR